MKIPLDSLDDPQLADYRSLKASNQTRWANRFVTEGRFVVQRLLASDLKVHSLLVAENHWDEFADKVPDDVPAYVLPKPLLNELIGFRFHQGVLACGERPASPSLDDLLARAPKRLTWAACSRVIDPVNLATIIRLSTAFGASGLLLGAGCADPYSRRCVRVSMGNVFRLPVLESADLKADLSRLRAEHDHTLFATVLDQTAEPLHKIKPGPRNVLLFGNEGEGLSEDWIEFCDRRVTIPMRGETDSLNVAVAAGIFLYHFDPYR